MRARAQVPRCYMERCLKDCPVFSLTWVWIPEHKIRLADELRPRLAATRTQGALARGQCCKLLLWPGIAMPCAGRAKACTGPFASTSPGSDMSDRKPGIEDPGDGVDSSAEMVWTAIPLTIRRLQQEENGASLLRTMVSCGKSTFPSSGLWCPRRRSPTAAGPSRASRQ